jgi:hypothetical protein
MSLYQLGGVYLMHTTITKAAPVYLQDTLLECVLNMGNGLGRQGQGFGQVWLSQSSLHMVLLPSLPLERAVIIGSLSN